MSPCSDLHVYHLWLAENITWCALSAIWIKAVLSLMSSGVWINAVSTGETLAWGQWVCEHTLWKWRASRASLHELQSLHTGHFILLFSLIFLSFKPYFIWSHLSQHVVVQVSLVARVDVTHFRINPLLHNFFYCLNLGWLTVVNLIYTKISISLLR